MDGRVDDHSGEGSAHHGAFGHPIGQRGGRPRHEQVSLKQAPLIPGVAQLYHGVARVSRDRETTCIAHGVHDGVGVGSLGHRRTLPHVTAGREAENEPCK